jgi:energy-coupling factor transporter ATP-binding protein EcfA2
MDNEQNKPQENFDYNSGSGIQQLYSNVDNKIKCEEYENEERISLGFGLDVKKYETICLVAPTGAGKSTLLCNIMVNIDPTYRILFFALEEAKIVVSSKLHKCFDDSLEDEEKFKNIKILDSDELDSDLSFNNIFKKIRDGIEAENVDIIIIDH